MPNKPLPFSESALRWFSEDRVLPGLTGDRVDHIGDALDGHRGLACQTYILGLDALQVEPPTPYPIGFRVIELENLEPQAFFDVYENSAYAEPTSAASPCFELFKHALGRAIQIASRSSEERELRFLRVPGLNVEAVWLHSHKNDLIIPLGSFAGLTALTPTAFFDALVLMRHAARTFVPTDETENS